MGEPHTSDQSGAIEKVQRFTPRGAECRLTHVKGFTGPLCHCPPLRCKAVPLEELAAHQALVRDHDFTNQTVTKWARFPITEERPRDVGAPGAAT